MSAPRQVRPESGGRRALLDTPLSREQTLAAVQDAITADSDLSRGPAAVTIGVRLFAGIRREAGVGELTLELPDGATVADALAALAAGPLPFLDPDSGFATAVNREYTPRATRLADGDELALVPPISGG